MRQRAEATPVNAVHYVRKGMTNLIQPDLLLPQRSSPSIIPSSSACVIQIIIRAPRCVYIPSSPNQTFIRSIVHLVQSAAILLGRITTPLRPLDERVH